MISAARGIVAARSLSKSSTALALAQRGDPGPSSRKSAELRVRSSIRSGQGSTALADRDVLDGLLNASALPAPRQSPFGQERPRLSRSSTPRLGNRSSAFPGRARSPSGRISGNRRIGGGVSTGKYDPNARQRFDPTSQNFYIPRSLPPSEANKLLPNPYDTSRQLREWIKAHPAPINSSLLQEAIGIVTGAERGAVNAVVWNALLGLVGRQGSLEKMWKLYNDMKKSGIEPTSRTYTTLINAYAGASHAKELSRFNACERLEPKLLQRITTIYNQSQTHISECVEALDRVKQSEEDVGLGGEESLVEEDAQLEEAGDEQEISLGPTNAYLKFLGKYGRWEDMERIYVAMDKEGPLAPDAITYSSMFSALLSRHQQQEGGHPSPTTNSVIQGRKARSLEEERQIFKIGPLAAAMWDQAVRQLHPIRGDSKSRGRTGLDNELALSALQCLCAGRPGDQSLATRLIPFLWDLPVPGSTVVASSVSTSERNVSRSNASEVPAHMRSLPLLPLDSRAAKSILSMLSRANQADLAAHYAEHFLENRELLKIIDWGVIQACIHVLSNVGKVDRIIDILNSFQPPTGASGWPKYVWINALTAARWSARFPAAMHIFRRMTHLPHGFEDGRPTKYTWSPPNGKPFDVHGRRWIPPQPMMPDAKCMSLFLKTAIAADTLHAARQAWTVFSHYPLETFFVIPRKEADQLNQDLSLLPPFNVEVGSVISPMVRKAAEWRLVLARDVESIAEKVLEGTMGLYEVKKVNEVRRMMGELSRVWGAKLGGAKNGEAAFGDGDDDGEDEDVRQRDSG